jgi:hypothetical protein
LGETFEIRAFVSPVVFISGAVLADLAFWASMPPYSALLHTGYLAILACFFRLQVIT